ncbi:MAG TPA: hypothetical protein DEB46_01135 [Myxococcales bacterium]|nr:hypothetical protein [Myxococcales bacterium]
MKILAFASLIWLGSACALHKPRPAPTVAGLSPTGGINDRSMEPAAWWESFGDENLNQVVGAVLKANLDLKAMDQQVAQQQAMTRLRRAGLLPQLNLAVNGNLQPGQPFPLELPPSIQDRFNQPEDPYAVTLTSQFTLGYEADLFGRLRHGRDAAQADALAARADRQTMALSLAGRTVELYLAALEARARLKQLRSTLTLQQKQLSLLKRRHERGLADLLAVHQQEQLLATTGAQIPLLENSLTTFALQLAALQGRTEADVEKLGKRVDFPSLPKLPEEGLPASLILRRPDVAAAIARLKAADHRLGEALVSRYPSLRIQAAAGLGIAPNSPTGVEIGDLGQAIADDLQNIFDNPTDQMAWNMGGSLTVPLFSGGRLKAQIDAAKTGYQAMALRYRKTVIEAVIEMSNSMAAEAAQRAFIERLLVQERAVRATRDLAMSRYQEGLIGYQTYLQAELSLNQVTGSLISAQRQMVSHRVTLLRSLAGPISTTSGGGK